MARGNEAKTNLINKIVAVFGADYIGEYDKKHYFWSSENGEQMQVAISMTCPKNPVTVVDTSAGGDFNFEDMDNSKEIRPTTFEPAEITQEERNTVMELMSQLGI